PLGRRGAAAGRCARPGGFPDVPGAGGPGRIPGRGLEARLPARPRGAGDARAALLGGLSRRVDRRGAQRRPIARARRSPAASERRDGGHGDHPPLRGRLGPGAGRPGGRGRQYRQRRGDAAYGTGAALNQAALAALVLRALATARRIETTTITSPTTSV